MAPSPASGSWVPAIFALIVTKLQTVRIRIILHREPRHTNADTGPDGQAEIVEDNLAIERLFDQRLVLVLILVEVDERGQREDGCHQEDDQDTQPDESSSPHLPLISL